MSELQFPKDPVVGQQYDFPPYKYCWDGIKWKTMGIGYNPVNELRNELEPKINSNTVSVFEALRRSYAEAGLNLVDGSFEEGGTLASTSDVLLHKASGIAYSGPIGSVAVGTDPTAVESGYVPCANALLRNELADENSAVLIAGITASDVVYAQTPVASRKITFAGYVDAIQHSSPKMYGGVGSSDLLSSRYDTLLEAQSDYPFVTSLAQTIDYAAAQLCINEAGFMLLDDVYYLGASTLDLPSGTVIDGLGRVMAYTPTAARCGLVSSAGAVAMSCGANSTTNTSISAPRLSNFNILSDYPLVVGNPNVLPSDTTPSSAYMRLLSLDSLILRPVTQNTGIAINLTKCFDHLIMNCDIENFDRHLRMLGCDIGTIKSNRFNGFTSYAIADIGSSSFGSQNVIENNDILHSKSASGTHIVSSSRHVRIKDNYLEQADASGPVLGFMDIGRGQSSLISGEGAPSTNLTAVITDNRIDGAKNATGFVYRLANDWLSLDFSDVGAYQDVTTPESITLYPSNTTALYKAPLHKKNWRVNAVRSKFNWADGFNGKSDALGKNNKSSLMSLLGPTISAANLLYEKLMFNEFGELVLLPSFTAGSIPFVGFNDTTYFESGVAYKLRVAWRADVVGNGLRLQQVTGGSGGATTALASTQIQTTVTDIAFNGSLSTITWQILAPTSANTGNVYIKSVEVIRV